MNAFLLALNLKCIYLSSSVLIGLINIRITILQFLEKYWWIGLRRRHTLCVTGNSFMHWWAFHTMVVRISVGTFTAALLIKLFIRKTSAIQSQLQLPYQPLLILCQVISLTSVYHAMELTVIAIKKNELKQTFLSCANTQMVANISPYKYSSWKSQFLRFKRQCLLSSKNL